VLAGPVGPGQVRERRSGRRRELHGEQKRLLGAARGLGDPGHEKGIDAVSVKVSESQGFSIQAFGVLHGCHTCGTRYAKDRYHADHDPPVFFSFTQTQKILKYANEKIEDLKGTLDLKEEFVLKPQCPRCSHEQGGRVSALKGQVETLAQKLSARGLIYAPKYN
jgi:hypothetical protein